MYKQLGKMFFFDFLIAVEIEVIEMSKIFLTLTMVSSTGGGGEDIGLFSLFIFPFPNIFSTFSLLSSLFSDFENVFVSNGGSSILLLDWMSSFALFATSVRLVTTLALLSNGMIRLPSLAHSFALFGPETLMKI